MNKARAHSGRSAPRPAHEDGPDRRGGLDGIETWPMGVYRRSCLCPDLLNSKTEAMLGVASLSVK